MSLSIVVFVKTGLWVFADFPMIGCSPDGIVLYEENGEIKVGQVEIKCPYILFLRETEPKHFDTQSTANQLSNFCLSRMGYSFIFKTNHSYFYQVQVQMGVHKLPWCDLVVW